MNLFIYHSEVKLDYVIKTVSKLKQLRYFLVDKLLTWEGYKECHWVGRLSQLLLKRVKHFVQEYLHTELPLQSVEHIGFVLFVFCVEPALGYIWLQQHWDGEIPYFGMIGDEVQHCVKVFLRPVLQQKITLQKTLQRLQVKILTGNDETKDAIVSRQFNFHSFEVFSLIVVFLLLYILPHIEFLLSHWLLQIHPWVQLQLLQEVLGYVMLIEK